MTPEIERLAKEAGFIDRAAFNFSKEIAKLISLIAEECAKECEEQADSHQEFKNTQAAVACDGCAAAIRAKFPIPKDGS